MALKYTPQAEADLDEIWDYIALENPEAARRFLYKIHDKCEAVSKTPVIGRKRPELGRGVRSFPVGNYIIFFRIDDDDTTIVRVLHGRRDLAPLFK